MKRFHIGALLRVATITMALGCAGPALALDELLLIAPAAPGGGWDQTARALQESMQSGGIVKTVTVENIPGTGLSFRWDERFKNSHRKGRCCGQSNRNRSRNHQFLRRRHGR